MEFSAQQIAHFLQGSIEGDPMVKVHDFSKIEEGKPGTLSFLANPKYEHYIYETNASVVLVNNDFKPEHPLRTTIIRVPNAYASLATLLTLVQQSKKRKQGVDLTAWISPSATIGEDCYIGHLAYIGDGVKIGKGTQIYPQAYIGDNVTIGENSIVYPHATIYEECSVGNNCIIHAGAVIGADGFGFAPKDGSYEKIPQLGKVIIEDDVEIGANTTIDRAVMDATIIHKGVKIDNLVQIAHNVEIGDNTVMAAQVGIAGSTKVGKHCMFGGQVGLAGHIHITDNVNFGAQSGVISDIKEPTTVLGAPAIHAKNFMKSSAIFNRLPDIYRTIGQMEKEIERLKQELKK